jgi:16S rRNA (guanine527-N7)-methyltransferase
MFHVKQPVEKQLDFALEQAVGTLGITLAPPHRSRLLEYLELLLRWNTKINLTSVTDPLEAIDLHLVDSLAAATLLEGIDTVVDLGAGGGLPSIPLAIVLPKTRFTLVESVGKKVGFLKAAIAQLGLKNARASRARARGRPEAEGIDRADATIARALLPPAEWLELGRNYVRPRGLVLAMLGSETAMPDPLPRGLEQAVERAYRLPRSGAERRIVGVRVL